MNNRLKQFLAAENITQAQFADNINVVRASVSHVLSGRNNPGFDFIKAMMEKYPRLNIEWLIFGKGKMYKDLESPKIEAPEDGQLFPVFEPEAPARITDNDIMDILPDSEPLSSEINYLDSISQSIVKQRKVTKIIILFDDGSFQEM